VTTRPSSTRPRSTACTAVISFVFSSTASWPSVRPRRWLTAESRCVPGAPCVRLPRNVLPSIATPSRARSASHPLRRRRGHTRQHPLCPGPQRRLDLVLVQAAQHPVQRRRTGWRRVRETTRRHQPLSVVPPPFRHRPIAPLPAQRGHAHQRQDRLQAMPLPPRRARIDDLCYNILEWTTRLTHRCHLHDGDSFPRVSLRHPLLPFLPENEMTLAITRYWHGLCVSSRSGTVMLGHANVVVESRAGILAEQPKAAQDIACRDLAVRATSAQAHRYRRS